MFFTFCGSIRFYPIEGHPKLSKLILCFPKIAHENRSQEARLFLTFSRDSTIEKQAGNQLISMYSHQFKDLCSGILSKGVKELKISDGVYLAIVSRIEDDDYEIVAVNSKTNVFKPGETFPLGNTLCKDVFAQGLTTSFTNVDKPEYDLYHPLYDSMGFDVYIGTPIRMGNTIWGTLNFSDMMPSRKAPFTKAEIDFVEKSASELSNAL